MKTKYSSSGRNLRDIYSRSGGQLMSLILIVFCLLFSKLFAVKCSKSCNVYGFKWHLFGTWEISIRGRVVGWRMSCILVVVFFSKVLFLFLLELFRLYVRKLKKTRQTQKQQKNNKTTQTIFEYLFAVGWWAGGCPVFSCCISCNIILIDGKELRF